MFTQGNTQSMDSLNRLEIFIPEEADAKTIHLCSLPAILLKRMGLPLHDSKDSKKLAIWISPAVLRRKGQKPPSNTGKDALENASSLLGRRFQPLMGPFKMPISSTNRAICNMLKDMNQGKTLSTCKSPTPLCPRDSPPQTGFPAIVIYRGCVYLCISKNKPSKRRQDTPSTHSLSSESQKKVTWHFSWGSHSMGKHDNSFDMYSFTFTQIHSHFKNQTISFFSN